MEYRKEAAVSTVDPNGQGGFLGGGNFFPIHGEFNVIEGFAELDIPLIKNGIVQSLDGNSCWPHDELPPPPVWWKPGRWV